MSDSPNNMSEFLTQVTAVIEQNMANEQFGVSELADALNMSRSNLLRKVKKDSNLSISQLINQVRLTRAMELLRTSTLNVSEVSHQVGFNSTSYFIKCFREYYGYPPGEAGKRAETEPEPVEVAPAPIRDSRKVWILAGVAGLILLAAIAMFVFRSVQRVRKTQLEKSIAVLPFKNESNDSTNVYLINGLMESTLGSLQKIKDLRVISRTSSEKYRNSTKSIPEMAKELNVTYFVEGSGQKIGDQILLNIQLIEASGDRHLWSRQYKRETKDIFQLQQEIAKNIAEEIKVIITAEEEERIIDRPTDDLVAYDLFLKGKDLQMSGPKNQEKAIGFFKQAIQHDPEFAVAYSEIAITYYNLDIFKADKKYTAEIINYADKAILYDSKRGESLVAKAMAYMSKKDYKSAVPYLERALEYNPNSVAVIGFLADFYGVYVPNTGKYLQYALKGVQLDIASMDSVTASYTYLRLANALIQTGFVDESLKYIDKSLAYNPVNPFSRYIRAFILYAKTHDTTQTRDLLLVEFNKDTTRFDILQDIAKISYYRRDFKTSFQYYKRFLKMLELRKLDVYRHEDLIISYVYAKAGQAQEAQKLLQIYKGFIDTDQSIYHDLFLAGYYVTKGDRPKAIEHMKVFSKQDNVQYWIILFLESDPIMEPMVKDPEFMKYLNATKSRFWKQHNELQEVLSEQGLL